MNKSLQNAALCLLLTLLHVVSAHAQGTAFTYQGRLNDGANPANGTYDFVFAIYGSPAGTIDGFANQTNAATAVSNGLFATTLDLGQPGIFSGPDRWLEIEVRSNGNGGFTTLAPRQKLTPTPYAITAGSVVSNGLAAGTYGSAVTFNNSGNSFSGNGSGLANVNALTLGGIGSAGFWQTAGNAGTTGGPNYLGTMDNQPLELHVNGLRALRLEPNINGAPNLIGGAAVNFAAPGVVGAVIAGGGAANYLGIPNTNSVSADFGTLGGGEGNTIQAAAYDATIGGGYQNMIQTNASSATIGGGYQNAIQAHAYFATIPGGKGNVAGGFYSFAAGQQAQALHQGAFVWADSQNAVFASSANDQFLVRAAGGAGINTTNPMGNALCVNGDTRIDAQPLGYNEGLALNFPTNMSVNGGYGGIHFHSTAGNGAFGANSIKWGMFYNYTPENGITGNGLAFAQNNNTTRLYISTNGNVGIGTLNPTNKLMVVNARCDGSSWINASDRNLKQGFAGVDAQAVLARVAALPVTTWSYKAQPEQKHLGPVAQDFHAAFGLGADDVSIATVDESGVALAAIQGLNQKVDELKADLNRRDAENAELKKRLAALEKIILNQGPN